MTRTRVGIVGAGQLGRMLALAGYPLGIDCTVLDRTADAPGAQVAASVQGALDGPAALAKLAAAGRELGQVPSIAEAWVKFDREVSLIGVQGANGSRAFYPLAENVHHDGILATTVAPFSDAQLQRQAEAWLTAIMTKLDYRG